MLIMSSLWTRHRELAAIDYPTEFVNNGLVKLVGLVEPELDLHDAQYNARTTKDRNKPESPVLQSISPITMEPS